MLSSVPGEEVRARGREEREREWEMVNNDIDKRLNDKGTSYSCQ